MVRADAREAGHYLSRERMAAAGDERTDFESAIAMLQPYVSSGRFKPFDGATELSPECARSLRGAIRRATRCM